MTGPILPACSIQSPSCGACGEETSHDGDVFYCWPCELDYGDGADGTTATYYNPGREALWREVPEPVARLTQPRPVRLHPVPTPHRPQGRSLDRVPPIPEGDPMTPICAVDCETTSLRPDRRAWDVALIRRDGEGERRVQFFIELDALDLPNADPFSLNVGRFWARHPQATRLSAGQDIGCDAVELWSSWAKADVFAVPAGAVVDAATAAHIIAGMTHGAHLIGAVPNFDAEVLAALLRDNGLTPSFHYHLIDVEALAVGWVCAWDRGDGGPGIRPPWRSDDLSTALGVPPPAPDTRHTALGDAEWALAIYDHITGGWEKP